MASGAELDFKIAKVKDNGCIFKFLSETCVFILISLLCIFDIPGKQKCKTLKSGHLIVVR